jgi:hypothetical protein
MKKNPLSEIYESKILLSEEASKSNVVVPSGKMQIAKGDKVGVTNTGGAGHVKGIKKPHEGEEIDIDEGEPKAMKSIHDSLETPSRSFEGSFEKLFKATIKEELGDEEESSFENELDAEIPTTGEEMVDELEGDEDELTDLVSDLKSVMGHLQNILDKVSQETEKPEETEETEIEFGSEPEEETEEETEERPMGEATELKPLGDKSKALQNKNNKVGSVKPHGGKAHGGDIDADVKLKPAKAHDKALQNVKSKPEIKSTVKKGEFFK